jgi:hypothetical protein
MLQAEPWKGATMHVLLEWVAQMFCKGATSVVPLALAFRRELLASEGARFSQQACSANSSNAF